MSRHITSAIIVIIISAASLLAAGTAALAAASTYSYTAVEALWRSAGGSASAAPVAACIAMHESGGNPDAVSPTDDIGLFQVHVTWGPAMATTDAYMNTVAAIKISGDGTDWSPWTTAPDCGV